MSYDFIAQPHATFRIGDFLKTSFEDHRWTEFRAAVAFVKRSGTKHIRDPLERFSKRGCKVKISAGIDAGGTSAEGLDDLLRALDTRGKIFIFKNANSSTFHPKVYLFRNDSHAELIVGSGNLTEGGLFTNYEASFLVRLSLSVEADAALLANVLQALDSWCSPTSGLCYELNSDLLSKLVHMGHVPDEAKARGEEKPADDAGKGTEASIFIRHSVPSAPKAPQQIVAAPTGTMAAGLEAVDDEVEDDDGLVVEIPTAVTPQGGSHSAFLMTLQKTDVGVGQTTKGTARRSPEIFIPLVARDYDPVFWGWPNLFTPDTGWAGPIDNQGRGKMDRPGVMVRLGGATVPIHMWYNPDKKDLRLRSENMRSAGAIGDILYVERSNGSGGFSYYVDVVPQGSPKHVEYLSKCTEPVRNSKKHWGYL